MRRPNRSLLDLDDRERPIRQGEAELEGRKYDEAWRAAPAVVREHFSGKQNTTDNAFALASFAAEGVVREFEKKLFDWLEQHHCPGCRCGEEHE